MSPGLSPNKGEQVLIHALVAKNRQHSADIAGLVAKHDVNFGTSLHKLPQWQECRQISYK